ncbi:MAG TPA: two-component regulator propeller domain-containing protein [Blastocatellia bacterium]|nr:two-component regulator propeller domain-containing protein [Blastocatellia bacterium]
MGQYGPPRLLFINNATVIFQDKRGLFWIGSPSGLYTYDEQRDQWADFNDPQDPRAFRSPAAVCEDGDGRIWLREYNKEFRFFDGQSWRTADKLAPPVPLPADRSNMFSGIDGKVWFVTNSGLLTFDGERWAGPGLPPSSIDDAYARGPIAPKDQEDQERILRRAERQRELARRQARAGKEVSTAPEPMARLLPNIFRGFQDRSGNVWLGARKAIVRLDPKKNDWTLMPPMGCAGIWVIYEDRRGRIWFADHEGHLSVFTPGAHDCRSYDLGVFFPQIQPKMITSIYEDKDGQIMVGTRAGGLVLFNEKDDRWRIVDRVTADLPLLSVTAIFEDNRGRIWIGMDDGLLVLEQ